MTHPTSPAGAPVVAFSNPGGLPDPAPNGYSHLAVIEPGARLVFVSGQGGDAETGVLAPDFRGQARRAFGNLVSALAAAGAEVRDVAKLTILIVDHSEERLHVYVEELKRAFGPDVRPASTLIPVHRLALDGMLIEIDATAAVAA